MDQIQICSDVSVLYVPLLAIGVMYVLTNVIISQKPRVGLNEDFPSKYQLITVVVCVSEVKLHWSKNAIDKISIGKNARCQW